jgi:hypothetical protein
MGYLKELVAVASLSRSMVMVGSSSMSFQVLLLYCGYGVSAFLEAFQVLLCGCAFLAFRLLYAAELVSCFGYVSIQISIVLIPTVRRDNFERKFLTKAHLAKFTDATRNELG